MLLIDEIDRAEEEFDGYLSSCSRPFDHEFRSSHHSRADRLRVITSTHSGEAMTLEAALVTRIDYPDARPTAFSRQGTGLPARGRSVTASSSNAHAEL